MKDRTEENRSRYASQRNYCVSLLKKTKKEYFGNLNEFFSGVSDRSTFIGMSSLTFFNRTFSKNESLLFPCRIYNSVVVKNN